MIRSCLVGWLLIPALVLAGHLSLKDHPARGEWHFNPEKMWGVDKAGDGEFGRIAELLVSEKEYVCARDFGHNVSYIFDRNGAFIRKFAPQGAGAGQLPFYLNRFPAGDSIVLAAPDRLHYFSQDGVFERAVENDLFVRFPLYFMSEREFIYAPNLPESPVHDTKLISADLISGKERTLVDFSEAGTGGGRSFRGPMLMIPSLTPQVRFDYGRGTMVFGRSDAYKLFIADRGGKVRSTFSLDRKRTTATLEDKRLLLAHVKMAEERKKQIIAQLPDETTFFSRFHLVDGFICVFAVTDPRQNTNSQQIDIFSDKGEYLYRGKLEFGDGLTFAGASDLVLKGRHAYVIVEDSRGKQTLAKYRISLPR